MLFAKPNLSHTINESVIAATFWLMTRYQQTGCKKIARLVEQHLARLGEDSDNPVLAQACEKLRIEWRAASRSAHFRVDCH